MATVNTIVLEGDGDGKHQSMIYKDPPFALGVLNCRIKKDKLKKLNCRCP